MMALFLSLSLLLVLCLPLRPSVTVTSSSFLSFISFSLSFISLARSFFLCVLFFLFLFRVLGFLVLMREAFFLPSSVWTCCDQNETFQKTFDVNFKFLAAPLFKGCFYIYIGKNKESTTPLLSSPSTSQATGMKRVIIVILVALISRATLSVEKG